MAIEPNLIDARGLKCPLPVLKLEKRMAEGVAAGELVVLATDPMARVDIALYCRQNGLEHTLAEDAGGVLRFTIDIAAKA